MVAKVGRERAPHKTLVALTGSLITAVVLTPAGSSYLLTQKTKYFMNNDATTKVREY